MAKDTANKTSVTLNGAPVNIAGITATIVTPASNPGVTLNPATGVVSVAPGTTPPDGSVTVPVKLPNVDWAAAAVTRHKTNSETADTVRRRRIWTDMGLLNAAHITEVPQTKDSRKPL